jgi:hypothetical protein
VSPGGRVDKLEFSSSITLISSYSLSNLSGCAAALTAAMLHTLAHNVFSVDETDIFDASTLSASLLGGLLVGTLMRDIWRSWM